MHITIICPQTQVLAEGEQGEGKGNDRGLFIAHGVILSQKKAADKIVMTRIYKGRNLLYRLGVVRIYKRRKLEFIPSIYVYT